MSPTVFDSFRARSLGLGHCLLVGLDPHESDLEGGGAGSGAGGGARNLVPFCRTLIEATCSLAVGYKINSAFFEAHGAKGWIALAEVVAAIPPEVPWILDAKRGDIGSTAKAYAAAAFRVLGASAATVNPWLGLDTLEPWLEYPGRGIFALCRTSNPGAEALVEQRTAAGVPLYVDIARRLTQAFGAHQLGLVVGATAPPALQQVRALAPEHWLLAPGVGAQGASAQATVSAGMSPHGAGILVNVSRGISRACQPQEAAVEWAQALALPQAPGPVPFDDVAMGLFQSGCVRFGSFTLKSGQRSPFYIDLRRLVATPSLLAAVASRLASRAQGLAFHCIAALPYAALPIGTAVCLQGGWPLVYPRREEKSYGTGAAVEGVFAPGQTALILDDLATTAASKLEALEKLNAAGLRCADVLVLIDRQGGAKEALAETGLRLHAVYTISELLAGWQSAGCISAQQREEAQNFIDASPAGLASPSPSAP